MTAWRCLESSWIRCGLRDPGRSADSIARRTNTPTPFATFWEWRSTRRRRCRPTNRARFAPTPTSFVQPALLDISRGRESRGRGRRSDSCGIRALHGTEGQLQRVHGCGASGSERFPRCAAGLWRAIIFRDGDVFRFGWTAPTVPSAASGAATSTSHRRCLESAADGRRPPELHGRN